MSTQAALNQATTEALLIARELGFQTLDDGAENSLPVPPLLAEHLRVAQKFLDLPIQSHDFPSSGAEPRP
jgi:hypothetical protein